jgi:hypothetical protein
LGVRRFLGLSRAFVAVGVIVLVGVAGSGVAGTRAAGTTGCSQLAKIRSVFPAANTVGFISRNAVKREPAREPIWPGWCGRTFWWTTYTRRDTGTLDVSVALYATSHDVGAALIEPLYGPVHVESNGARVRTYPAATNAGAVSAYRNLFISSVSIDTPEKTVPVAAQLRLHRAIETRFRSLR